MSEELKADREDVTAALGDAVQAIRACVEDFTRQAAESRDQASAAVRQAGADAAGQIGALSDDAQDKLGHYAASLARMATANPLAALAIAAGAGFALARATRGAAK